MQQRYMRPDGSESAPPTNRPSESGLLDQLVEKLKTLVGQASSPIMPTGRLDQISGQERAAESPDAPPPPPPTPTKKPAAAKVTDKKGPPKHDGWFDAGFGTGPLNAQGQQWQGTPGQPPAFGGPPVTAPPAGGRPAPPTMPPVPAPGGNPTKGTPPPTMPPVPAAGGGKPAPSLGGPPVAGGGGPLPPAPKASKPGSGLVGHDGKKKQKK